MGTAIPMGIVSLKAEGAYAADKLYKKGMWVTSSGSSYAYINPTPAAGVPLTDTSHWQQIADKGDTGLSAYDAAIAGGYTGTEVEFNTSMSGLPDATDAANEAANYAVQINKSNQPQIPLIVPTPYVSQNAAHPSVVSFPLGFNGYKYWMAFTPYPPAEEENPCICASNDLIEWVVPEGLTNPVAPKIGGEAAQSDPHLVIVPEGGLRLYYRQQAQAWEKIWLRTSEDGITWSERQLLIDLVSPTHTLLSPSVIIEPSGSYRMWSNAEDGTLYIWESVDGLDWGAASECVLPEMKSTMWHSYVVLHNGVYHCLVSAVDRRLYYLRSSDGVTWESPNYDPIVSLTGYPFDVGGHYRSAFLPAPGQPLLWDVIVTGMKPGSNNGLYDLDAQWKLGLYKSVDMLTGTTKALSDSVVHIKDVSRIFLPAFSFKEREGSPVWGIENTLVGGWRFEAGIRSSIITSFLLPNNWKNFQVSIVYFNKSGGVGKVRLRYSGDIYDQDSVVGIAKNPFTAAWETDVNETVKVISISHGGNSGITHSAGTGGMCFLYMERIGDNASDTFDGTIVVLGMLLSRVDS